MQKENDFKKWLLPIIIGVMFSLCGVVFTFVIKDIDGLKQDNKTEVIIEQIKGLKLYFEEKFKRLEDKIDLAKSKSS